LGLIDLNAARRAVPGAQPFRLEVKDVTFYLFLWLEFYNIFI